MGFCDNERWDHYDADYDSSGFERGIAYTNKDGSARGYDGTQIGFIREDINKVIVLL